MASERLTDLNRTQKFELCLVRVLQGASYKELADYVKEEWGFPISRQTIGYFLKSKEGEAIMSEVYDQLRKEYSNEPVVEKSTRVLALREQAVKLQKVLRGLPVDKEWLDFSAEFRQYIKQIATEMEGLQINISEGKSAAELAIEAALAKRAKLKVVGDSD